MCAHDGSRWALLSLEDGEVVASDRAVEGERSSTTPPAATDDERLYTVVGGDLIVRDLPNLTVRDVLDALVPPSTVQIERPTAG